jgi:Cu-processing system ATP-binding protein
VTAVIELIGVGKCFGAVTALDEVTLSVAPGEIIGLLGHNGAGKTTTMKLILGLLTPTRGDIRTLGVKPSLRHAGDLRRQIGFLPENVSFYQQLSGREVLRYFARLKGVTTSVVGPLLERVGLAADGGRRVRTYSKGMRQRLGLAQALLGEPRLLMLDEPTAGLDPTATREFYGMLDELRGRGSTVLLSSHVLPGVEGHIDRAAILGRGRLLAFGSLEALRAQAAVPLTIRVRGQWASEDWAREIENAGMAVRRVNGQQLEFVGPEAGKLAVLRLLLQVPGIEDVSVFPPSLDELYAYFNQASATTQSAPCTAS